MACACILSLPHPRQVGFSDVPTCCRHQKSNKKKKKCIIHSSNSCPQVTQIFPSFVISLPNGQVFYPSLFFFLLYRHFCELLQNVPVMREKNGDFKSFAADKEPLIILTLLEILMFASWIYFMLFQAASLHLAC